MDKQAFIEKIAGYVRKYAVAYGITVHSPIIAQAVLESGYGESRLAAVYHNYFGLKCGTKWTGKSVNLSTMEEYTAGVLTQIKDNFRVYDNMEEGVKGYFDFIQLSSVLNRCHRHLAPPYQMSKKQKSACKQSFFVFHSFGTAHYLRTL